jgi:hypothetical protein
MQKGPHGVELSLDPQARKLLPQLGDDLLSLDAFGGKSHQHFEGVPLSLIVFAKGHLPQHRQGRRSDLVEKLEDCELPGGQPAPNPRSLAPNSGGSGYGGAWSRVFTPVMAAGPNRRATAAVCALNSCASSI